MDSIKRPGPGESFGGSERRGERVDDGDDVEGHVMLRGEEAAGKQLRGEGAAGKQLRASDDDDVLGHGAGKQFRGEEAAGKQLRGEGAGSKQLRAIDGDDDVEGHAAGKQLR